ncbi:MAG: hydrogenase 3 maturation endopeptidase HyCI [Kiritimatiellia bacterium]
MNLLLGIGNPRHGDDALGPVFARAFRHPEWRTVNAATAPENFTGLIRRLHPDRLVLLDAADLGLPPGTLRRLDPATIRAGDFGTHAGSLGRLAEFLGDCAGQVVVLGIQPAGVRPGARLSPPVRAALRNLAERLATDRLPP